MNPADNALPGAGFENMAQELLAGLLGPLGALPAFPAQEMLALLVEAQARDPARYASINERYYRERLELWRHQAGVRSGAGDFPAPGDSAAARRFRADAWRSHPYFGYLARSHVLTVDWLHELLELVRDADPAWRRRSFVLRQLCDAMSPANFPWSNPEAIGLAIRTEGRSLAQGLANLAADLGRGTVSTNDASAYAVGRDLAVTAGAVIHENDCMQLIQYRPATDTVFARPLVIVPPCINKYYILDLRPENSFVRHAVERGHTVFMVSWRNVGAATGCATWDDYVDQGVIRALDIAAEVCGTAQVNALGFCVGGTLLGSALAVQQARGEARAASLTLLASMLDFSDTGELSVFVDEAYVQRCEREFARGGVFRGRSLALTFSSLRANELIWRYVVHNYLMGRTPPPFDLLYWNADSTNLPGAFYAYYLRNMYLENNLRQPGRLKMCGMPVDLGAVTCPAYVMAARDDHIVPWRTAYESARLLGGRIEFVLSSSGHVAGVVNPPTGSRRTFWVNPSREERAEHWLETATARAGSWWPHWAEWLAPFGGERRRAPKRLGRGGHREIEAAPGRYVKQAA